MLSCVQEVNRGLNRAHLQKKKHGLEHQGAFTECGQCAGNVQEGDQLMVNIRLRTCCSTEIDLYTWNLADPYMRSFWSAFGCGFCYSIRSVKNTYSEEAPF
jgi:hypothetical protein